MAVDRTSAGTTRTSCAARPTGPSRRYAWAELGDITADQFRALAAIQRDFGATVRLTNRQNLVFRDLTDEQLPQLFERLAAIGMAQPGAELSRDVGRCPGADTCNLAVTQIAWPRQGDR